MIKQILYDWGGLNAWLFAVINGLGGGMHYDQLMFFLSQVSSHRNVKFFAVLFIAVLLLTMLIRKLRGELVQRITFRKIIAHMIALAMGYALYGFIIGAMKTLFAMPRPFMNDALRAGMHYIGPYPDVAEYFASFPSGHAATAGFIAAFLWPYASGLAKLGILLLVFLVCWSHIAIGMHFPADVIAGVLIGMFVAALIQRYVYRMMRVSAE